MLYKKIKLHGYLYNCELECTDCEDLYPTFELVTLTANEIGIVFKNKYKIKTKVVGINECTEQGLHFGSPSSSCINKVDENGDMYSNEFTLENDAVSDLFYELTSENGVKEIH